MSRVPESEAIERTTGGLVYLPDDSLEQRPRFHRYAIVARRLQELPRS